MAMESIFSSASQLPLRPGGQTSRGLLEDSAAESVNGYNVDSARHSVYRYAYCLWFAHPFVFLDDFS